MFKGVDVAIICTAQPITKTKTKEAENKTNMSTFK